MSHLRQAIETKYLGPTTYKGSRVRARCEAKTRYYHWDDSLNVDENHISAANRLFKELGWNKNGKGKENAALVGGGIKHTYVFVSVEKLASGLLREWE